MDGGIKYRGKTYTAREIDEIREVIAKHRDKSRRFIFQELCRRWDWRQPNGVLKDMICRGLLLHLEAQGLLELPPRKKVVLPLFGRKKPALIEVDQTPVVSSLSELKPIEIHQIRRTPLEKLYRSLIKQYHYLGYVHSRWESI